MPIKGLWFLGTKWPLFQHSASKTKPSIYSTAYIICNAICHKQTSFALPGCVGATHLIPASNKTRTHITCITTAMVMIVTLKIASAMSSSRHGYNIWLTIIDHDKCSDSRPPRTAKNNQQSKFL